MTVVVCTECGNETDTDEQFCESCGTYLGWWGERLEASPEAVVEAEEQAAAAAAPTNGAPTAVLLPPGKEYAPRPPRTLRQAWRLKPGDLICRECERPSPPHAHFCRHCGATLVGVAPVEPPRWRRWLRRMRLHGAGERPGWTDLTPGGVRHVPKRAFALAGGTLLASGFILLCVWLWATSVGGWAGRVANSIRRDVYPYYDPIRPAAVRGDPQTPGHKGAAAFDRDLTTFWLSPGRTGIGGRLIVNLRPAADVDRVAIFAGDPVGNELVPRDLRLAFFRWDSHAKDHWVLMKTAGIRLDNQPGFQQFDVVAHGAGLAVITVRGVYAADSPGSAAITEVEFFHKH